ncbi:MAG: hypothetical protein IJ184_02935 [Alphaproteobacteria bacterium]|nr:hypothetical protein [Alphaproteobacteria bacterium]
MIDTSQIYKIADKERFIELIKKYPLIRILTNGEDVYAWDYDIASHDEVRNAFSEITDKFAAYRIDKGRLIHSVKIDYAVMQKFISRWFPSCYYKDYITEYDKLDGLDLFLNTEPLLNKIELYRQYHLTAIADKIATDGKISLFIEDNELPHLEPHVHICVELTNRKYKGQPLRDVYWAQKYKSIFSIQLKDPSRFLTYDNVEKDENEFYRAGYLVFAEDIYENFSSMPDVDKDSICTMLNTYKYDLWRKYAANQEHEQNEQKFWQKEKNLDWRKKFIP